MPAAKTGGLYLRARFGFASLLGSKQLWDESRIIYHYVCKLASHLGTVHIVLLSKGANNLQEWITQHPYYKEGELQHEYCQCVVELIGRAKNSV